MRLIHQQRQKNDLIIFKLLEDPRYFVKGDGRIFSYVSEQGHLLTAAREIGNLEDYGFLEINYTYCGRRYKFQAHRVVFAFANGRLNPELNITHIDGHKTNNHPDNLTEANESESLLQRFGVYGNKAIRGNHKDDMKEKARTLRRNGRSVKEIEKKLGVARSSVSVWVRDIKLTEEQKSRLKQKISDNGGCKTF